jgi:hypothetical protein
MMADMEDKAHEASTDPFSRDSDLGSCLCRRSWLGMEAEMDSEDIVRVLLVGHNPQSFSLARQFSKVTVANATLQDPKRQRKTYCGCGNSTLF